MGNDDWKMYEAGAAELLIGVCQIVSQAVVGIYIRHPPIAQPRLVSTLRKLLCNVPNITHSLHLKIELHGYCCCAGQYRTEVVRSVSLEI